MTGNEDVTPSDDAPERGQKAEDQPQEGRSEEARSGGLWRAHRVMFGWSLPESILPKTTLPKLDLGGSNILRLQERLAGAYSRSWVAPTEAFAELINKQLAYVRPNLTGLHGLVTQLAEQARAAFPSNWDSSVSGHFERIISVVNDDGIPLAWVPRTSLVLELVEAEDSAARRQLLVSRQTDIAEDCIASLKEVSQPALAPLADYATEAAQLLADGRHFAAQSSATVIFDTLINDFWDRGAAFLALQPSPGSRLPYRRVQRSVPQASYEDTLGEIRSNCVLAPVALALTEYQRGAGSAQMIPDSFSRHASVHHVCPAQNTPSNATVAVMLVASILREAEESGW